MDSQFRDRHDVPNRGEIHLAGADHFRGSDDKSKNEGTQETRFRDRVWTLIIPWIFFFRAMEAEASFFLK